MTRASGRESSSFWLGSCARLTLEADALKHNLKVVPMEASETYPDGGVYRVRFAPELTGRVVYGVRVYPVHPDLTSPFDMGLIRWA